jgi:hypothetical protein
MTFQLRSRRTILRVAARQTILFLAHIMSDPDSARPDDTILYKTQVKT